MAANSQLPGIVAPAAAEIEGVVPAAPPPAAFPAGGDQLRAPEMSGEGISGARPALVVTVYGTPGPQGSKTRLAHGAMVESSKKVGPWREAVKTAAFAASRMQAGTPHLKLDGPLLVEFAFTLSRPKGHYRTGRNAHLLRNAAPAYPAGTPDLSKLIRSTEDALTDAGVWADDARIVRYRDPRKVYAGSADPDALDVPGAVIRIWEVT